MNARHALLALLTLLLLAGCGQSESLAARAIGRWETEGATITLDTRAGTYEANIAGQRVARTLTVTRAEERTLVLTLDNGRELLVRFAPDSWDKATMEVTDFWTYDFRRAGSQ